jgi:hypothetical protein
MNNNRSHDYENYVNSYGMQEIRNEAKKARMLKDSGLSGSNVLTRIVAGLGKLLVRHRQKIQYHDYSERELSIHKR